MLKFQDVLISRIRKTRTLLETVLLETEYISISITLSISNTLIIFIIIILNKKE